MSNKTIENEHREIREKISDEVVKKIELAADPFSAVDLLAKHEQMHVCAIMDKMTPLSAAIVFGVMRLRAYCTDGQYNTHFYEAVIKRCEKLDLPLVKGCVHARNETYRLTGVFIP